ncbi:putative Chromodomain-helicase-Dna-binding protein 4, partial [Cardiosporidium cionae]
MSSGLAMSFHGATVVDGSSNINISVDENDRMSGKRKYEATMYQLRPKLLGGDIQEDGKRRKLDESTLSMPRNGFISSTVQSSSTQPVNVSSNTASDTMVCDIHHGYSTRKLKPKFKYRLISSGQDIGSNATEESSHGKFRREKRSKSMLSHAATFSKPARPALSKGNSYNDKNGIPANEEYLLAQVSNIDEDHETSCYLCGAEGSDWVRCSTCVKVYHKDCLDPPITLLQPNWICPKCLNAPIMNRKMGLTKYDLLPLYTENGVASVIANRSTNWEGSDSLLQGSTLVSNPPVSMPVSSSLNYSGCAKCGLKSGHRNVAVICDCCDREFHLRCLRIHELPLGDWFCSDCIDLDVCAKCVMEARQGLGLSSTFPSEALKEEKGSRWNPFRKLNERIQSCVQCHLKFHQSCVPQSCPVHLRYNASERLKCFPSALPSPFNASFESITAPLPLLSKISSDGTEKLVQYSDNTWICAFCQELNGIAKILSQRECYDPLSGTWETQVLCKFKELSYRKTIWLPAERAKLLHLIQWKKWEVHYETLLRSGIAATEGIEVDLDETEDVCCTDGSSSCLPENRRESQLSDSFPASIAVIPLLRRPAGIKSNWLRVSRLLYHRRCIRGSGRLQYLVKWKSLPYDEITWEEASVVIGSQALAMYKQMVILEKSIGVYSKPWSNDSVSFSLPSRPELPLPVGCELKEGTTHIIRTGFSKQVESSKAPNYDSEEVTSLATQKDDTLLISPTAFVKESTLLAGEDKGANLERLRRKFRRGNFVAYNEKPAVICGDFLYDYQLEGINWMRYSWHKKTSIILADEMGLGKTVQLINFISSLWNDYAHQGPFLIVAPLATLEDVWVREFSRWAPYINVIPYFGNPISRARCRFYEFYFKHNLPLQHVKQWYAAIQKAAPTPEFDRVYGRTHFDGEFFDWVLRIEIFFLLP